MYSCIRGPGCSSSRHEDAFLIIHLTIFTWIPSNAFHLQHYQLDVLLKLLLTREPFAVCSTSRLAARGLGDCH